MNEDVADVIVVGAGPAGLAAAAAAAGRGARVLLVDAGAQPGGQVWRARGGQRAPEVDAALAAFDGATVQRWSSTQVAMALPGQRLLLDGPGGARVVRWKSLVLASGARERLLPFPGWTLPGVFGAGGLQALVKGGWPIRGQRVLVAGTGPLLLAAAATLRQCGAKVVGVVEEATRGSLVRFGATLLAHPAKAVAALRLGVALAGVPYRVGRHLAEVEADGEGLCATLVAHGAGPAPTPQRVRCDAVAVGWGLVPQVELAQLLGCAVAPRFGAPAVTVDGDQATSVRGIWAAGELAGVAGRDAATLQGTRAGLAAAAALRPAGTASARPTHPDPLDRALAREWRFAAALAARFPVPAGWAARLRPDTLICRCEDVPWRDLAHASDLHQAKLATRCGMGHCQGRLCHDALSHIHGLARPAPRPPLVPLPLSRLAEIPATLSPLAKETP